VAFCEDCGIVVGFLTKVKFPEKFSGVSLSTMTISFVRFRISLDLSILHIMLLFPAGLPSLNHNFQHLYTMYADAICKY
jgi:hypothetical protein